MIKDKYPASADLSPTCLFGGLLLLKMRFLIQVPRYAELPKYTGLAWRGVIGREAQRLLCHSDHGQVCKECSDKEDCPYFLMIEKETSMSGLAEYPRGYVIYPPVSKGSYRELFVTLIGNYAKFVPVTVKALLKGRDSGIGRHPYNIVSCEEVLPDGSPREMSLEDTFSVTGPYPLREWLENLPDPPKELTARLVTPVSLCQHGKYLNIMNWPFYFDTLVRRLEALNRLFNDGAPLEKDIWLSLQKWFKSATGIRSYLRWWDIAQYSTSKKQGKSLMGGLVGKAVIKSPSSQDLEWWKTAELVHVGKGAAMGLGKVEIF